MKDLYVEVNGSGPDLVLLHGWGLNVRVWDSLVEELRNRFRMIAVDLLVMGGALGARSRERCGAGVVDSQHVASVSNRYSLLGWSLGGQIALDLQPRCKPD